MDKLSDEFKIQYWHSGKQSGKTFKAAIESLAATLNSGKNKFIIEMCDSQQLTDLQEELDRTRRALDVAREGLDEVQKADNSYTSQTWAIADQTLSQIDAILNSTKKEQE